MPKGKFRQDTFTLLKKAFSAKKLDTRKKYWSKVQNRIHLKPGAVLSRAVNAVKKGDEKHAVGIITAIIGAKNRKFDAELDAPRNISLKSSKSSSSKSSRFEKAEKRKRDEEVIPRKKYVIDEYQKFPIFSKSKVVAWIGDDVMKFVLAGDYQEVEKRLSSQDAFRAQDGKIRDEALKSTEFASFVRNSLIETTKAIYKYRNCMYKNTEVNDLCNTIIRYGDLLQQGKTIDYVEVGDAVKRLTTLFAERNGKLGEPLAVDDSSLKAFVTKAANIVTDARIHEEEINFLKEAMKNCGELKVAAKRKAGEALEEYNKAKRERNLEPQADSYEQDMKRKKEGEILQAQFAKHFIDNKTEAENYERAENLNSFAIEESHKNWQKNVFNETFLKSLIGFGQDTKKIFQSILINLRERGLQQEDSINKAQAVLPQVITYLKTVVTEDMNSLPPKEDDDAKVTHYRSMAKAKREEAAASDDIEDDKNEEINDLKFMINQNAHGRATGESSVSNAALRQKVKEAEIVKEQAHKAKEEANRQAKEFETQADHIEATRANIQQKAETIKHTEEQASAFQDQRRINIELSKENINEGNSFVETINLTTGQVEHIEEIGEANIHNQAKEEPIQDINEEIYSKIMNDVEHYDGLLDDQIQIIRHEILRYTDQRDHLPVGHRDIPRINNLLNSLEDLVAHYEAMRAEQTANSLKRQGYSVDSKTQEAFKDVFRDREMRQDPRYGAQAQQRVPTTADVKIEPSIEKTLMNLQVPQYQQKSDLLNIPLSGRPAFAKKPATPKKYRAQGGFVVGSRPDPFINRAYWKNVYQRLNK